MRDPNYQYIHSESETSDTYSDSSTVISIFHLHSSSCSQVNNHRPKTSIWKIPDLSSTTQDNPNRAKAGSCYTRHIRGASEISETDSSSVLSSTTRDTPKRAKATSCNTTHRRGARDILETATQNTPQRANTASHDTPKNVAASVI